MPNVKPGLAFTLLVALSACGDTEPSTATPDAATPTADAPASVGDCSGGGDQFVLSGPVSIESSSLGPVTVEGKVAGFSGATSSGRIFTFTKRHVPLDGDFESVGSHDVTTEPIKFLDKPFEGDCSTAADGCSGFFALAGTVTVTAIAPRFVATFELTDLYARSDNSDAPGPAIAGTITGCVDSRLDP